MLNLILSVFFLISCTYLFIESFAISGSTKWDILGARFFPQLLLGIANVLILIIIYNAVRELRNKFGEQSTNKTTGSATKDTLVIFFSVFLFLVGLKILGFFVGAFALLLLLQLYLVDWKFGFRPVLVAGISTVTIYYVFTKFLNVLFPMGILDFI